MKIKITKTTQYLIGTRDIQVGDTFKVISTGFSESKKKNFYLIYSKNDKATIIYGDEAEEIIPKTKKLKI